MGSTNKNLTDQNIDKPSFDLQQSQTVIDWWSVSRHASPSTDSVDCTICWQVSDKVNDWRVSYVNVCCDSWQLLCFGMFARKTENKYSESRIPNRGQVIPPPMEERESTQHCHIYTAILSAKYTNLIVISLHKNMRLSVDIGVLNR